MPTPRRKPNRDKPITQEQQRKETVAPLDPRGDATLRGGNKIHGDDLQGVIPTTPLSTDRDK